MRKQVLSEEKQKIAFWMLAISASLLVVFYIYSLNIAVFNVARRGTVEKNISTLHNSISDLESKYIALKKGINMDLAYSLGYKEIENTTIVPKKSVSVAQNVKVRE